MSNLATLKLTAAVKPTAVSSTQNRRNKLLQRLNEQLALVRAKISGTNFSAIKTRSIVDKETGLRRQGELTKRVKPWWFFADNGKVALSIRYGTKVLELGRGKFAVEVATEKELPNVFEVITAAVAAGELDAAIDTAANKLRAGFVK